MDDLNLVRILKELTRIVDYRKMKIENKDLGKQNFVLANKLTTF